MKNKIFVFLVAAGMGVSLISPAFVFADVDVCSNLVGDQAVVPVNYRANPDGTCSLVQGNGNPATVSQAWGLTGAQSTVVPAGATITDEFGFSVQCGRFDACIDLTRTDYYRNQMRDLARSLIATGQAGRFPMFSGWISSVR